MNKCASHCFYTYGYTVLPSKIKFSGKHKCETTHIAMNINKK